MDALKARWPSLLAIGIGLTALLFGIYLIRSEANNRRSATWVRGVISEINPLNERIRTATKNIWVRIRYVSADGSEGTALATVRLSSHPAEADSITALFEAGRKNARVPSWRDWSTGASFSAIGVWFIGIGVFIRNLLVNSAAGERRTRRKASQTRRNVEGGE